MFSCFICAFLRFHFFSLLSIIHVSFYFHLNVNVNIFLFCLFCVPFYPLFYLLFVRLIWTPRLFVSIVSIRNQFDPWTRCFFPISCCFFFWFCLFSYLPPMRVFLCRSSRFCLEWYQALKSLVIITIKIGYANEDTTSPCILI